MSASKDAKTPSRYVNTELNRAIGHQLRTIRNRSGMSQSMICTEIFGNASMQANWSRWENGTMRPNVGTLEQIAEWAGVPVSSFGVHDPKGMPTEAEVREARELLARAMILLGG